MAVSSHASPLSSSTPELCNEDVFMLSRSRQPIGSSSSVDLNSPRESPLSPLHYAVNNGAAASPGSGAYSPVHADTPLEFRVMLNKVADKLDENNVSSIAFIHELPAQVKKDKRPLACFEHLQKVGIFSWKDTNQLKKLLQDIDRHDLVTTLVEEYETLREQNRQHHTPVHRQNTDPLIVPQQPWSQQSSLPTATFPFNVRVPQQCTSVGAFSSQDSEEPMPSLTASHKEEQSKEASGLSEWDFVDIPKPRSQSSGIITEDELPAAVKDPLSQSMPSRTRFCQLLLRTIKPPGTFTTWSLQAKELLPSSSAKCHVKLSKKSIDVKCIELPRQKFTCNFTVHPPSPASKCSDFLSLEVTVITKYATSINAHLDLMIIIRTKTGSELGKHHVEKPLQSFHLSEFLSIKKLQQLSPDTKIVMEIQAKIAVTMDYVVVDMDSN